MAEVTGLRNNAEDYPIYGLPWGVAFPILDADGDKVTGAASLDSEVSKNGDTPADCTNEAQEIGSSGGYVLLLTGTELTADVVQVDVQTGTAGAKTSPIYLYPRKLPTVRSGTAAGGATGSVTLDSGALAIDGAYAGCVVAVTIDGTVEVRKITGYVGSTKVASVTPDFTAAPDSDDTFVILQPTGVLVPTANLAAIAGGSTAADQLRRSAESMYYGTITGAATATTLIDSGLNQGATDHWNRRVIIFLTGVCAKQASHITAFTPASDTLTFDSLTDAPTAGDTYVIL